MISPGAAASSWAKSSTGTPGAAEPASWAPGTTTNRTSGAPARAADTLGRNSAVVTTPTASESTSAFRSSSSLTRKISGVTTPPALVEQGVVVALPLQRQLGLPGQVLLSHTPTIANPRPTAV